MATSSKIRSLLLKHRHSGSKTRHTIIAYTFNGNQIEYAINSYSSCCMASRNAGHYFDHAETKLIQQLSFVPKTIYIEGITQSSKSMSTTLPCDKCMKFLKLKGVKRIVCNYLNHYTTLKLC